jgi:four helix bundle protein
MPKLSHEKLDVYRLSIEYGAWIYVLVKDLAGTDRHARDQMLRASQSISLNIAEGNGRGSDADRRRFFEIARGSALECAASQDLLEACGVISHETNQHGKQMLVRIVSMLTKLGQAAHGLRESTAAYGSFDDDNDHDHDLDSLSGSEK